MAPGSSPVVTNRGDPDGGHHAWSARLTPSWSPAAARCCCTSPPA